MTPLEKLELTLRRARQAGEAKNKKLEALRREPTGLTTQELLDFVIEELTAHNNGRVGS